MAPLSFTQRRSTCRGARGSLQGELLPWMYAHAHRGRASGRRPSPNCHGRPSPQPGTHARLYAECCCARASRRTPRTGTNAVRATGVIRKPPRGRHGGETRLELVAHRGELLLLKRQLRLRLLPLLLPPTRADTSEMSHMRPLLTWMIRKTYLEQSVRAWHPTPETRTRGTAYACDEFTALHDINASMSVHHLALRITVTLK